MPTPSQIGKLIAFAKTDTTQSTQEISFGHIPHFQSQAITAAHNLNVKGALKTMTNHGVMHAIKEHGNDEVEKKRNQKGLIDSDFEYIPKILLDPDEIIKGNKTSRGEQGLVYRKRINGLDYHAVMAIRENRDGKKLVFTTMYVKK